MAGSEYLADNLIDAVREEGLLPASDEESTDAKVLRILNREQRLYLAALVRKVREGYLEDSATLTIVAGTTRYRLPARAVASAVTLVEEVVGDGARPLQPLGRKQASDGAASFGAGDYYFEDAYLVLVVTPSSAGSLRVTYQRRMNKVVAGTEACVVTAINTGTKAVTLALASDGTTTTLPSGWSTSRTYDFIRGTPHFDVLDKDLAITGVASNVLTFSATLDSELAVGDMVALAGETPIANLPLEAQDVLVLKACHSYLSGLGNADKAALVAERLKQAEEDLTTLLTPRAKETLPLLQNFNAPGWNRGRAWRRFGGR